MQTEVEKASILPNIGRGDEMSDTEVLLTHTEASRAFNYLYSHGCHNLAENLAIAMILSNEIRLDFPTPVSTLAA